MKTENIERKGFVVAAIAAALLFMERVVKAASNKLNLTTQAESPGTSTPGFVFGALPTGVLAFLGIGTGLSISGTTLNAAGTSLNFADFISVTPSGSTITLANAPSPATSLSVFKNGQLLQPGSGNDYTVAAAVITLAVAPVAADNFQANYRF